MDSTIKKDKPNRPGSILLLFLFITLGLALGISENVIGSLTPLLLLGVGIVSIRNQRLSFTVDALVVSTLAFFIYVFASALWAEFPDAALSRLLKLGLLLLPAYLIMYNPLIRETRSRAAQGFLYAYLIGASLYALQIHLHFHFDSLVVGNEKDQGFNILDLNSLAIAIAVLLWLALAAINHQQSTYRLLLSAIVLAIVLLGQWGSITDAGWISLLCGLVGFWIFSTQGRAWIIKCLLLLSIIVVLILPSWLYTNLPVKDHAIESNSTLVQKILEPSHLHRLEIWDRCRELFLEKPLFGWGLTGSYHLPETSEPSIAVAGLTRSDFLYPHNIFLQLLIDFGVIGLCLFLALLQSLISTIERLPNSIRAYAGACFCSVLSVYYFGFPLWRSWWVVLIACTIILFVNMSYQTQEDALRE